MSYKVHVLVVNNDLDEGKQWRDKLSAGGCAVLPECHDLSSMFYVLTQEKVHVVICAGRLFKEEAISLLKTSQMHFPRIKIVFVGVVSKAYLFNHMSNIAITKSLPSDLEKYCYRVPVSSGDAKQTAEQTLLDLLGDHFMSDEDASARLAHSFKWSPGYIILCVKTDASSGNVLNSLKKSTGDFKRAYLVQYNLNEYYIIVNESPNAEHCVRMATDIREYLFKETNAMFSIGISRMRHKAGELYACRKEAERASNATHMFGQNSVIHIDYLDSNDIEYIYPAHKEKRLIEATMDGDISCALQMLDEIFAVFKSREDIKQSLINKMVLGIVVGLNIAASSRVTAFEKMNLDSLALKKLMSAKTYDEAYTYLKQGIEDFATEIEAITDVSRDALFYRLSESKEKPSSIDDLAQELGTTLCFLNTAIYKNNSEDVFSFISKNDKNDKTTPINKK